MKKFEGWRTEELQFVATLIAGREMELHANETTITSYSVCKGRGIVTSFATGYQYREYPREY